MMRRFIRLTARALFMLLSVLTVTGLAQQAPSGNPPAPGARMQAPREAPKDRAAILVAEWSRAKLGVQEYIEAIIINEHDVVLVDAGGAPTMARNVIAEIKKLTSNPVRYIIYTHIHRDHRFGTQEYVKAFPGVEIISHPAIRDIIDGTISSSALATWSYIRFLTGSRMTPLNGSSPLGSYPISISIHSFLVTEKFRWVKPTCKN